MINLSAVPTANTELLIVNAARVSLSKRHSHLCDNDPNLIRFLYQHSHWTPFGHPQLSLKWPTHLSETLNRVLLNQTPGSERVLLGHNWVVERGSLWYWLKNKHLYGPLESDIDNMIVNHAPVTAEIAGVKSNTEKPCAQEFPIADAWVAEDVENRLKLAWITALVEAPVPIRTQLFKHKHGFVENEVSRRYVSDPPSFFHPAEWRARAPNVKQGSLNTPVRYPILARGVAKIVYAISNWGYRAILGLGGCPEQARFLLAQGMMTQWYWTGSLDAVFRAIRLRSDPHAQVESWQALQMLNALVAKTWPETYRAMSLTSFANTDPKSLMT